MQERRSRGAAVLRTSFLDSRRLMAAVIEPLVSRTFFPITFTGCGPLWRRTSNTAKSEKPRPSAETLRAAFCSTARAAFQRTTQTRTASGFDSGDVFDNRNFFVLLGWRLCRTIILDVEVI